MLLPGLSREHGTAPTVAIPDCEAVDISDSRPPHQEGFSLSHVSALPLRGLMRAMNTLRPSGSDEPGLPVDFRTIPRHGYNHLILISEPDPEYTATDDIHNQVALPGLSEMGDRCSAYRWHKALARQHPERRTITITNDGISHGGDVLSIREALNLPFETMADDRLSILHELIGDEPVDTIGTSMDSVLSMYMADQNLGANPHEQLSLRALKLVVPAVIACRVPRREDFRDKPINENIERHKLTLEFLGHLAPDYARMLRSHPREALACAAIVGEYLLGPHKLPSRGATIYGNLTEVQRGVDWGMLKRVVRGHKLLTLGGGLCPLMQAQIPQNEALAKRFPGQVYQRVRPDRGHLWTIAASEAAAELAELEAESIAPVLQEAA